MLKILEVIPATRRLEVIHDLDRAVGGLRDYLLLVFLSCVIATFGLVLNSAAALALVRGDLRRLGEVLAVLFGGVVLAVALSTLLGTMVSLGGLNFLEELPSEVTSRTHPTLFDLVVALAGGAAGAYALAQPNLSATLPGVAIATALMPPLCVAGIGLSQGRGDVSGGSLLLFLANLVAILFASSLIFTLIGFGPIRGTRNEPSLPHALLISSLLMVIVTAPLVGFMFQIAGDAGDNLTIRTTLGQELAKASPGSRLAGFVKTWQEDHLLIEATVRSPGDISRSSALELQRQLASKLRKKVAVKLLVVPVTLLDPLAPPPETPAPTASGTAPALTPTLAAPLP